MKIIDADRAKEIAEVSLGDIFLQTAVKLLLDKTPTVDFVEVVHGRWKQDGIYYRCSVCHKLTMMPHLKGLPQFNYCPNCGADMR